MGAYERFVEELANLSEEDQRKVKEQMDKMCRTMAISTGASHLVHNGYLYEDDSPASPLRSSFDGLFEEGDHYVYIWKHLNGDPFYVGSGKGYRSRSISANRPDRFYAELLAFDAILCYVAFNVSEKDARFIEHYCSFSLTMGGINLTNGDWNAFRMSEKVKERWARFFENDKDKTDAIDRRLEFLVSKVDRIPEHYHEIVKQVWKEYGTLYHLTINGNLSRAVETLDFESIDS